MMLRIKKISSVIHFLESQGDLNADIEEEFKEDNKVNRKEDDVINIIIKCHIFFGVIS